MVMGDGVPWWWGVIHGLLMRLMFFGMAVPTLPAYLLMQVLTYSTKDRFRQNKNKTFKGHNTAGYACQVNFSPDCRCVGATATVVGVHSGMCALPSGLSVSPNWSRAMTHVTSHV